MPVPNLAYYSTIESVSLHAWPALEKEPMGPFLLRFANGFTKRANSAVLTRSDTGAYPEIAAAEAWYAKRKQPAIFRITEFTGNGLEESLENRGYQTLDPSFVMTHTLPSIQARPPCNTIRFVSCNEWLKSEQQLNPRSACDQHSMERILACNAHCSDYALLKINNTVLACGLGIQIQGHYALFCIRTAPEYRRQGHGTSLVYALLHRAKLHGMHDAWLQVLESNAAAIGLYQSLGFVKQYRYWYRVRN